MQKAVDGSIAFVFGRNADGKSVCVRIEGVRPKLFYAYGDADTPQSLGTELEDEVRRTLRGTHGIELKTQRFTRLYDYDPDPTTASGSPLAHVEASYPSVASWRAAVRLRRPYKSRDGDDEEPKRGDEDDVVSVTSTRGRPPSSYREAHEWFIDPVTRFNAEAGIVPGTWIRTPEEPVDAKVTTCDPRVRGVHGRHRPRARAHAERALCGALLRH